MLELLLSPIDPSRPHEIGTMLSWHARLMVLAWGILVPLGILSARYFKIWPGQRWPEQLDNRLWWALHRLFQYSAACLTLFALALILTQGRGLDAHLHRILGWLVVVLVCVQVASGLLRGTKGGPTEPTMAGDHFDMTPRRIIFEFVHKSLGYIAQILALAALISGLWYANGPLWMWVALAGWWTGLGVVAHLCQRRQMSIDTYQAIWGPDEGLPGNKLDPIGFGIVKRNARNEIVDGPDQPQRDRSDTTSRPSKLS